MIIERFASTEFGASKVRGQVSAVLFDDQITHLKRFNFWPKRFAEEDAIKDAEKKKPSPSAAPKKTKDDNSDDDPESNDSDSLDLPGNPNRVGVQLSDDSD